MLRNYWPPPPSRGCRRGGFSGRRATRARGTRRNSRPQQLTAPPRDGWITNGGNLYNQRYSPLARINKANVATLKPAWRTHLNGSGTDSKYSGQAQPIVYDGVIYIPTGANDVFALDADDGKILWTYEAHLDPNITVICCGWMSRGVALGDGKVFSGQLDGKLVALDHATGKVVWSVQAETNADGFSITTAPLYYDGLVITGFAGGDRAARGRVKAFDARTGKLVWTFYTIPGPGEFGHDTWPSDNDTWKHGGAAIWQTPAVDPELGLVYFSTGNPGPDLNGSVRPGRQPVQRLDRRDRGEDRQIPLAFPAGASRPLGLRLAESRGAVRRAVRRPPAQGHRRDRQDGLRLHPRSRDRQAARRHRGAAGAAGAAPGDGRDAAVSRSATTSCRTRSTSRPRASSSSTRAASSRRSGTSPWS